ncbi:MAG: hypothetical protein KBT46_00555 [Ruminococcus sp.]|nr:hypothetical protein [Candidatus Copronaster equi]
MRKIIVTKKILEDIFDERKYEKEITDYLNQIINNELLKDEPDFDLIDDCTTALIDSENKSSAEIIPFPQNRNVIPSKINRRFLSVLIACIIVISAGIGAIAVGRSISEERKKTDEFNCSETTESSVNPSEKSVPETTIINTTKEESIVKAVPEKLKLSFDKDFKSEYNLGEKLSVDGINVTVIYSDKSEKKIDIKNCKIVTGKNFGVVPQTETVSVEYQGLKETFKVNFLINVASFNPEYHFDMTSKTEIANITAEQKVIHLDTGEKTSVTLSKNRNGFVRITTDNNNLENITLSYVGGVKGNKIVLNITAGKSSGTTNIGLAYETDNRIIETVTVNVSDTSNPSETNPNISLQKEN